MEMPTVDNIAIDKDRNIRFNIRAYRKLTEQELLTAVRVVMSQKRGRPKKNTQVTVLSLIGLHEAG